MTIRSEPLRVILPDLVGLGLSTSKTGTYAPPRQKRVTGWPISR